jgi:hypothetical protein
MKGSNPPLAFAAMEGLVVVVVVVTQNQRLKSGAIRFE